MHKTDATDHVTNLFSDGDPGVPRLGTVVDEDWLNAVQEELINILTVAGVTPVKGTWTQVLTALRVLLLPQALSGDYAAGYGRPRLVYRTIVSGTVSTAEVWITVNAAWNGSAWAKDVTAADSIAVCLVGVVDSSGPAYGANANIYKSDTNTATFADTDWSAFAPVVQVATSVPTSPWVNTGGSLSVMKYWRNPIGDICLQGTVSHGGGGSGPTVDPLGTLPAGYRPATDLRFTTSYVDTTFKHCTILITSAGVITSDAPIGAQVRLDGIRFPVGV